MPEYTSSNGDIYLRIIVILFGVLERGRFRRNNAIIVVGDRYTFRTSIDNYFPFDSGERSTSKSTIIYLNGR